MRSRRRLRHATRSTAVVAVVVLSGAAFGCSRAGAGGQSASTEAAAAGAGTPPPVPASGAAAPGASSSTSVAATTSTTAGAYTETGVKQRLPEGGTLAVRSGQPTSAPKGAPPPPPGSLYAVVAATFCAAPTTPLGDLDPARFRVEVGGQGYVVHTGTEPPIGRSPLAEGTSVAAGTCLDVTVSFVIAGELHIETVAYDTPAGPLRWAA